ncbi:MAG TPA: protein arginine kinase [Bacillota bacterium]|nr:protein arginine kinase [Bacillota bacterium]
MMHENRAKWMCAGGREGDIVISTRVRLARNLSDVPFPGTMNEEQAEQVLERVSHVLQPDTESSTASWRVRKTADLSSFERLFLVEQHLISPVLASSRSGAVALSEDASVSIMINEEDHLRIQAILPGLELEQAYDLSNEFDDALEAALPIAFHEEYGYLTACPTNAGTGMRASVMIHLPGLASAGHIGRVLAAIGQFGLMARGLYGEGTQATGNIFQISNQVTSGLNEQEILKNLSSVISQIVSQERVLLGRMLTRERAKLEDKVYRALGTLQNARILSGQESMSLLSDLRLGVAAGLLGDSGTCPLNELLVNLQPGSLQHSAGRTLLPGERDVTRADMARKIVIDRIREDEK